MAMAYIGFFGALSIPEREIFTESDHPITLYGYPVPRAYSRIMPEPFIRLQWACRSVENPVYRPILGQLRDEATRVFMKSKCNFR